VHAVFDKFRCTLSFMCYSWSVVVVLFMAKAILHVYVCYSEHKL